MPIIDERLQKLAGISLKAGAHSPDSTFCVMEAAAWIAGEPWSDHPQCVSPVIGELLRAWNDALPKDADRDRLLKPLIPRIIGTANGSDLETRRSLMAADWLVRVHTPAWLRLAGLVTQAESLERLPEIASTEQIPSLLGPLEAVRKDAYAAGDAAWAAAWAAARAAAGAAAWAAAGDAAGDAAWAAARDAARDAAGDAAWAAARDAAGAAAKKKLAPTVAKLQESALQLVNRMIDAKK